VPIATAGKIVKVSFSEIAVQYWSAHEFLDKKKVSSGGLSLAIRSSLPFGVISFQRCGME
jgi:hypothetical protein